MDYAKVLDRNAELLTKNKWLESRVDELADRAQVEVLRRHLAEKKLKELQKERSK